MTCRKERLESPIGSGGWPTEEFDDLSPAFAGLGALPVMSWCVRRIPSESGPPDRDVTTFPSKAKASGVVQQELVQALEMTKSVQTVWVGALPFERLKNRHRDKVFDIPDLVSSLQDLHWLAHSQQHRADRFCAT